MKKITYLLAPLMICAVNTAFSGIADQVSAKTIASHPCIPFNVMEVQKFNNANTISQTIFETVKNELVSFLEIIPVDMEKEHGFNDRAEFSSALPASVYKIVGVDATGKTFETNLYNVVVAVKGEYRAVLTVSADNGQYEIQAIGATLMAKELQAIEQANPLASDQERIMFNVYQRSSGFVGYKDATTSIENMDLIPLESAKSGISNIEVNRKIKTTYKLAEAMEALDLN
jgi:hypothetical protein